MDCSPPGSAIHGILQARVLEWGAVAFKVKCAGNAIGETGKWISLQANVHCKSTKRPQQRVFLKYLTPEMFFQRTYIRQKRLQARYPSVPALGKEAVGCVPFIRRFCETSGERLATTVLVSPWMDIRLPQTPKPDLGQTVSWRRCLPPWENSG